MKKHPGDFRSYKTEILFLRFAGKKHLCIIYQNVSCIGVKHHAAVLACDIR